MGLSITKYMLQQLKQYKLLTSVFLISLFIEVSYSIVAPLSLKFLVDAAFIPKDFQVFVVILLILLVGGFINIGANATGDYALGKVSGGIIQNLRMNLFFHLQKQSLPFYQRYRVGDLVPRFSTDMSSIQGVISSSLPYFLKEVLSVLLGLIILFTIEWKLTLAMLIGSYLMIVGPRLLQGRAEENNRQFKEVQERFSNTIDEMAKGHKVIKSLHQHNRYKVTAEQQIRDLFSFGFKMHMINSLLERLPLTALLILNGTMLGFGGYLIFHDHMTIGDFIAFFTLFMSVGQSGSNITFLIPSLIDSRVSFRRVWEIFDQKPTIEEEKDPIDLSSNLTSIQMEGVTFGYTDEANQLQGVNLQIAAGSYVAFVGPSGSGKSTALQLLSRFYDPKEGKVLYDGYDVRKVSEASLRKLATLVTQDTILFNSTIRDNLVLDGSATEEEMIEVAKQVTIHPIISKWSDGYDTMIYQEGSSLSGGERQRIAFARALLRRPKVLLLDEVTSALDPVSESGINQLIQDIRSEKTIISVTHRLSSIANADVIHVFKDGRIEEVGTHQELLQNDGVYKEMWEKQHGFYISSDGLHATVEVERLSKLPFFNGIDHELLQNIASLFSTETYKEGETIVHEGEEGNKFYIIVRGMFEVCKQDSGEGNKRVAVLEDGDHFGEIALLKNIPRTATVKAMTPSVLLSVRREAFNQITKNHPDILNKLEITLKQRM